MFQSNNMKNNMSSILGPEVEINGDVKVAGDLLIYGKVYGNILSEGAVNSAKGSLIKGDVNAKNASISGTVEGNLNIQSKIILGKNSYLTGNLKAAIITIEEGARFDGMCSMVKNQTETIKNKDTSISSSSLKTANEQI
tara:strand:+ start:232 stop:648 length:417 start_codon:yes stop_codon:yes gene_type:complete